MRRTVIVSLVYVACLVTPTFLSATNVLVPNGNWWLALSENDKAIAVEGMKMGFQYGWVGKEEEQLDKLKDLKSRVDVEQAVPLDSNIGEGDTAASIANRIDAVYLDHPDVRNYVVGAFFECAAAPGGDCETAYTRYKGASMGL